MVDLRAVVLEAPERLTVENRTQIEPRPTEVLVDVASTGICGTDVSIYAGKIAVRHPLVMGHEMAGRVAAVGSAVDGRVQTGARVIVDPNIYCSACYQCSKGQENICTSGWLMGRDGDGGFTEAVAVPASNVYPLPAEIDDLVAPLIQVLTVCTHGQRNAPIFPGDSALVLGLGVTGLLHLQIAKARGASPLIGVTRSPAKRKLAEDLGADLTLDPADPSVEDRIKEATGGHGPDVVIEAVGQVETLASAISWVRIGGHIVLYGTITAASGALPFYQLYYKEITITNPRAAKAEDFPASIALVASGAVELRPLVTEVFSLTEAAQAIDATKQAATLKVILDHKGGLG